MSNQNVTLSIPKKLLRKARVLAVTRDMSLSALLRTTLEEVVNREEGYRQASQRSLTWLREGRNLGTYGEADWQREDLHER